MFLVTLSALFLIILSIQQIFSFYDGKLHVIFCNVGQGDAILIKSPQNTMFLVDSGPDSSVLNCLSSHLPFWKRDISMAILTHPHADHLTGLLSVLKDYSVARFVTEPLENPTAGYTSLHALRITHRVPETRVTAGKGVQQGAFALLFVGPTTEKLQMVSPSGTIGQSNEQGVLETYVRYGSF